MLASFKKRAYKKN